MSSPSPEPCDRQLTPTQIVEGGKPGASPAPTVVTGSAPSVSATADASHGSDRDGRSKRASRNPQHYVTYPPRGMRAQFKAGGALRFAEQGMENDDWGSLAPAGAATATAASEHGLVASDSPSRVTAGATPSGPAANRSKSAARHTQSSGAAIGGNNGDHGTAASSAGGFLYVPVSLSVGAVQEAEELWRTAVEGGGVAPPSSGDPQVTGQPPSPAPAPAPSPTVGVDRTRLPAVREDGGDDTEVGSGAASDCTVRLLGAAEEEKLQRLMGVWRIIKIATRRYGRGDISADTCRNLNVDTCRQMRAIIGTLKSKRTPLLSGVGYSDLLKPSVSSATAASPFRGPFADIERVQRIVYTLTVDEALMVYSPFTTAKHVCLFGCASAVYFSDRLGLPGADQRGGSGVRSSAAVKSVTAGASASALARRTFLPAPTRALLQHNVGRRCRS